MNASSPAVPSAVPFAAFVDENRQPAITGLFTAYEHKVYAQTNRLFWWLLIAQWMCSLFLAVVWSPRTWVGTESTLHPHVIAAAGLGGLLVSLPLALMRWMPHHPLTRHSVAVAQVGFSVLLIHLTSGRIETHFHIFGSLAFLVLYRDWRVLITATLVVVTDHVLRGLWYPESVYGVPYATIGRTVEHAGWITFEVAVLVWACFVSRREMWEICRRQDAHQQLLDGLEQRVSERTRALEKEVSARARMTHELSRSEDRYRTLIGNLPIGVFETTKDGRVLLANPYLLSLLGFPADQDLTKLNMADGKIIQPEERQRFWANLRAQIQVHGFETTLRTVSGDSIHVRMHARRNLNRDGTLSCEGTLEDVTARKLAERELELVHQRLVTASRQAGMADVTTSVLDDVGNALADVNVTVRDVLERVRTSQLTHLRGIVDVIQNERPRLASFLTDDPRGSRLPDVLVQLETLLSEENERLHADIENLAQHCENLRRIVGTQQRSARLCGLPENSESP
jgi:PAS domain S-box-containing protein